MREIHVRMTIVPAMDDMDLDLLTEMIENSVNENKGDALVVDISLDRDYKNGPPPSLNALRDTLRSVVIANIGKSTIRATMKKHGGAEHALDIDESKYAAVIDALNKLRVDHEEYSQ